MKSLLIAKDGSFFMMELPERHKYGAVDLPELPPPASELWQPCEPLKVRRFEWRGQINRQNNTELLTFFEEI